MKELQKAEQEAAQIAAGALAKELEHAHEVALWKNEIITRNRQEAARLEEQRLAELIKAAAKAEAVRDERIIEDARIAAEAKANKENIKARCEAALASLLSQSIDGLSEKQARKVILAIHRGLVDNVQINY